MRNHLIRVGVYAAPLLENRPDFCLAREFTRIGFGKSAFYLLDLPRFGFYERFECSVDDP